LSEPGFSLGQVARKPNTILTKSLTKPDWPTDQQCGRSPLLRASLVCKSLVISVTIHILPNFVSIDTWISKTYKLIRHIILSEGQAHVRMSILYTPIELEGLNMVNLYMLEILLKVVWFR